MNTGAGRIFRTVISFLCDLETDLRMLWITLGLLALAAIFWFVWITK